MSDGVLGALSIAVGALLILPASLPAQGPPIPRGDEAEVVAFTFEHQLASEALPLVRPLLSEEGVVQLQPGANTLVVTDTAERLAQIRALIEDYDHPPMRIRFVLRVVEAGSDPTPGGPLLPEPLRQKLRNILRYESFHPLGQARLVAREGQRVGYRVGDDFSVRFQVGTLLAERTFKLKDFRVYRRGAAEPLIHTQLNLVVGQTMVLGLSRSEESERALMVVIDSARGGRAARPR